MISALNDQFYTSLVEGIRNLPHLIENEMGSNPLFSLDRSIVNPAANFIADQVVLPTLRIGYHLSGRALVGGVSILHASSSQQLQAFWQDPIPTSWFHTAAKIANWGASFVSKRTPIQTLGLGYADRALISASQHIQVVAQDAEKFTQIPKQVEELFFTNSLPKVGGMHQKMLHIGWRVVRAVVIVAVRIFHLLAIGCQKIKQGAGKVFRSSHWVESSAKRRIEHWDSYATIGQRLDGKVIGTLERKESDMRKKATASLTKSLIKSSVCFAIRSCFYWATGTAIYQASHALCLTLPINWEKHSIADWTASLLSQGLLKGRAIMAIVLGARPVVKYLHDHYNPEFQVEKSSLFLSNGPIVACMQIWKYLTELKAKKEASFVLEPI